MKGTKAMPLNKEVFLRDPTDWKIPNNGVASVDSTADDVLRHELSMFVCDGQYAQGLRQILQSYLDNLSQPTQPCAWISGFYGSGKSHLVKMLAHLWTDEPLSGGERPRGLVQLEDQALQNAFRDLSVQGRRDGKGLLAAAGTLSAAGGRTDPRVQALEFVHKAVGLPAPLPQARFVLWLRGRGIENEVRRIVEAAGEDWVEACEDFLLSRGIRQALSQVDPETFPTPQACNALLLERFKNAEKDLSDDQFVQYLREALSSKTGQVPLTLLALDEVQQFIGDNLDRALAVQALAVACSQRMEGRVLLVATGQSALTGVAALNRIEGRFTVRVQLSDNDITSVVRKVVLRKKTDRLGEIEDVLNANIGEIGRHLADTPLAWRQEDFGTMAADYPVLPTRRRFWEEALRCLDAQGTDGQLRGLLKMNLSIARDLGDRPLGHVAAGDALFFQNAQHLLQNGRLTHALYEDIIGLANSGNADEKLAGRAAALAFLLGTLAEKRPGAGLRPTAETLADLLVEDITASSAPLRQRLPGILDGCRVLMKIGDEYRVQTPEGAAWNNDFESKAAALRQEPHRTDTLRVQMLEGMLRQRIGTLRVVQGESRTPRENALYFNNGMPSREDASSRVCICLRDGWSNTEQGVREQARAAGTESPLVWVYTPKRDVDALRGALVRLKAAEECLDARGVPASPEGREARSSVETIQRAARAEAERIAGGLADDSAVFQGGGNEIQPGASLAERVGRAAATAAERLWNQFTLSDNVAWGTVCERAQRGAADALRAIGYNGEPQNHPLCREIMGWIGADQTGNAIRAHFAGAPWGWTRDAVDASLYLLVLGGQVSARDSAGHPIRHGQLERRLVGGTHFRLETVVLSSSQKLALRQLFSRVFGRQVVAEELPVLAADFREKIRGAAGAAGGEAPAPAAPAPAWLDGLGNAAGNELLLAIHGKRAEIVRDLDAWAADAARIAARRPAWDDLAALAAAARELPEADGLLRQAESIRDQRLLLADPDPVPPLLQELAALLRGRLSVLGGEYAAAKQAGEESLEGDESWQALADRPEERHAIRREARLLVPDGTGGLREPDPAIDVSDPAAIRRTLAVQSLESLSNAVAALPGRYADAARRAAKRLEPQVRDVVLPSQTLHDKEELEAWLGRCRALLEAELARGPVRV